MTDGEAKILARLRRLKAQGRLPEMTVGDAAVTLGGDEDTARKVITGLVRAGALHRADMRHSTLPCIYRLAE